MTTDIDAILAQRAELKRRDPKAICLFRVEDEEGDFYRAYAEDAVALYRGVVLPTPFLYRGSEAGGDSLIGVRPGLLEKTLDCIVKAGKRAAVIERADGPAPAGDEAERIVTPGAADERPNSTPGPWAWTRTDWRGEPSGHRIYVHGDVREDWSDDEDDEPGPVATAVAIVEGNATSMRVTEANANLICAAPDLLAACKQLAEFVDAIPYGRPFAGRPHTHMDAALAAIRRAEGK